MGNFFHTHDHARMLGHDDCSQLQMRFPGIAGSAREVMLVAIPPADGEWMATFGQGTNPNARRFLCPRAASASKKPQLNAVAAAVFLRVTSVTSCYLILLEYLRAPRTFLVCNRGMYGAIGRSP
jgi:hypothetical protein